MSPELYKFLFRWFRRGSGWFRMVLAVLEGPRDLRSVPYDPEMFPRSPHLRSSIRSGAFECLGDHLNVSEDPESPKKNRDRKLPKIKKSSLEILKIMKNQFWIFSSMLFVRYPWILWGLGNVQTAPDSVFQTAGHVNVPFSKLHSDVTGRV